jgi:hypothetical protein
MSFQSDLRKFAMNAGTKADLIVKKVCLDLNSDLIKACPVDTGNARSNFFFGNERVQSVSPASSKTGAPSTVRALEFAGSLKAGGVFYITNNVEYIMPIMEYGNSQQLASGGLSRIVARWQGIVAGAAKGSQSSRLEGYR